LTLKRLGCVACLTCCCTISESVVRHMNIALAGVVAAVSITNVEGRAIEASLNCASCSQTCQLDAASVVTICEEGTGKCFFYPFVNREDADRHFASLWMHYPSRIMFECRDGLLIEAKRGGPARPHNTIRQAARRLELWGKVFVQGGKPGWASFHFASDRKVLMSFESQECADWALDDLTRLPARKDLKDVSYNPGTRTFTGTIDWESSTFCGHRLWEYELVFDDSLSTVVDGRVQAYTPGLTDRGLAEQMLVFGAQCNREAGVISYERWRLDPAHAQND